MVSFYIVRHGQTLLNSLDRAQGWTDSPLTDAGKQTTVELGHKLKGIDFNAAYTSDMLRMPSIRMIQQELQSRSRQ